MAGGVIGFFEGLGGALVDAGEGLADLIGLDNLWDWIKDQFTPDIEYPGVKLNKVGTDKAIPIVYGERRVGGIIVFKAVEPANHAKLHIGLVVSEGEIDSIGEVYLNDTPISDPKFAGLTKVTQYTGDPFQAADPDLVAAFPDYTAADILKNTAWVHVELTYNRDVFRGIPTITADVRGRKLYDPRTGTTAWSDNPALVLYDYLTNPLYGKGLPATALDTASFNTAATTCETQIETHTGSGVFINQFATNAVVNPDRAVSENITSLLTQCRGVLVFSGGLYRLEIEGTKAPSFALDADNIISHAGIKSGGKRQRFNRVKVEFTNPQTNWEKDFAIAESATLLAADGGLLLETTINRPFETDPYRAQYAAELVLKKSRESIAVSVVASHEALMVEVGDVVTVTHEPAGWVAKQFRAATVEIRPDLTVGLGLVEYEPTTYDRTIPASAFVSPPNTSLPDPSVVAPPSGVAVASGTAHLLTMGDGTLVTRAWVSWTASPDAYVDSYEVQAKLTTGAWGGVGIQGTVRVSADETGAYVYPVADGVNYDFRVRAVNTAGARSTWALFVGHLVLGKQEVPAIPNLVAYTTTASGRRRLTWRMPVVTPDLAGFEIRYYPALTGGGWNAASKLVDGLVAVDPNVAPPNGDYSFEWDHLPAGDYQFYVRPWDTSGLTSINAASSGGVTLPAPPLTSADWSQVTGLGRPQDNADVTANNTAAGIAGQGALATANSADWQTQVTGAGRPQDNADVTQQVIDTGILTTGAVWMNSGTFGAKGIQAEYNNGTPRLHVGDGANSYIRHDGTLLTWKAANTELDVAGNLTATNATFDNATMTNATVSGAITVGAGSSGISNLADAGAFATLNQINSANIGSYIADLSVDTLQIADNAVTVPYSAYIDPAVDMATIAQNTWQTGVSITADLTDNTTLYTLTGDMAGNTGLAAATEQVVQFQLSHYVRWKNNWIPSVPTGTVLLMPSRWFKAHWGDNVTFRDVRRFVGPWKPNIAVKEWNWTAPHSVDATTESPYYAFLVGSTVYAVTSVPWYGANTGPTEPNWAAAGYLGAYLTVNQVTYQNWGPISGIELISYCNWRKRMTTGGYFSSMLLTSTTLRK